MISVSFVDEARWLLTVDTFGEVTVQKRVLHAQLVHRPVT
jgi:hypothetical protein